jgi:hypothetical protein
VSLANNHSIGVRELNHEHDILRDANITIKTEGVTVEFGTLATRENSALPGALFPTPAKERN